MMDNGEEEILDFLAKARAKAKEEMQQLVKERKLFRIEASRQFIEEFREQEVLIR
jgi:hypothetical protein